MITGLAVCEAAFCQQSADLLACIRSIPAKEFDALEGGQGFTRGGPGCFPLLTLPESGAAAWRR